ncbi:ABC transporter permease subunit [Actinoplanes sp. TBRC 11911]|uniref:ABC transporter permease subunit n=1 Tax=Actinoplanes sp. TBRC 11911 TaxID=2729386 RepID=UPI00145EB25B|nr:ABC transporter permease subunit [Actinoplanes sp. TBRC 11911]NMO52069.1 ABC transporter permease subunit [Actinoplanes sp. TBRC 11911]
MSLYQAETRRLLKRRFTRLFVLGGLLILAAVAAGTFLTSEKVGPDQIAAAQLKAQNEYRSALADAEKVKADCAAAQGAADAPDCANLYTPTPDNFAAEWYMPPTFDFREKFPDMVTTLAAIMAVVAFIVGASFVGAEWSSGGMMNLLLWRPQRIRVLSTKLAAFLVGVTALTVVLAAAWTGLFVLIAHARGSTASMTSGAWQSMALMELRGLGLVVAAGTLGFGLASIGRHTAMALGAVVGLVIVFQFGLGTVLNLAHVKFFEAYLIPVWMIAWMSKRYTIQDTSSCDFSATSGCQPDTLTLTWQMAGTGLAAIFLLVVIASLWTMRKRDVT